MLMMERGAENDEFNATQTQIIKTEKIFNF